MSNRHTRGLATVLTAAGLVLAGLGCGSKPGQPGKVQSAMNTVAGQRLGALIAEAIEPGGEVVLVHLSSSPDTVNQWVKGLSKGLDSGNIVVLGFEELPAEANQAMGGYPALAFALQQYPAAAAIISTLPVGMHERPSFPAEHPPLYALGWSYLPDSVFLFRSKHFAAGIFEQPDLPPPSEGTLTPDEMFDRNYVVVTADNLRELVGQY